MQHVLCYCSNWSCPGYSGQPFSTQMTPTSFTTCPPCCGRSVRPTKAHVLSYQPTSCTTPASAAAQFGSYMLLCYASCAEQVSVISDPSCYTCTTEPEAVPNGCCMQGAQLEPQLGLPKFLLVMLELLVSSHVIMASSSCQLQHPCHILTCSRAGCRACC